MQYIIRYNIKPLMATEFRQWLQQNRAIIEDNQPEGWTYLGTWFTVRGFGEYGVEDRYEIADYAALGAGFGNETLQRLTVEGFEFVDTSFTGETYLMKNMDEVRIAEGF